jgi:hypothetical protein
MASRFTAQSYAIIGLLKDNPTALLNKTIQRQADKMVKCGWMYKEDMEIDAVAGTFEYKVKHPKYVPTADGLNRWAELHELVENHKPEDLRKAMVGERIKKELIDKFGTEAQKKKQAVKRIKSAGLAPKKSKRYSKAPIPTTVASSIPSIVVAAK